MTRRLFLMISIICLLLSCVCAAEKKLDHTDVIGVAVEKSYYAGGDGECRFYKYKADQVDPRIEWMRFSVNEFTDNNLDPIKLLYLINPNIQNPITDNQQAVDYLNDLLMHPKQLLLLLKIQLQKCTDEEVQRTARMLRDVVVVDTDKCYNGRRLLRGLYPNETPRNLHIDLMEGYDEWERYLETFNFERFFRIRVEFVLRLMEQGYKVKEIPYIIQPKAIPNFWFGKYTDYTEIAKKEGVTTLIVFSFAQGLSHEYDERGNITKTYAVFYAGAFMERMRKGKLRVLTPIRFRKLLWESGVPDELCFVPIEGKWNDPPNYPAFTEALNKAMDNAREYLVNDFFNDLPPAEKK